MRAKQPPPLPKGLSETVFHGDLVVNKFIMIVEKANFSDQFKMKIKRYKQSGI